MRGIAVLGVVLIVAWVVGFVVFKVAGALIHLLLFVGAIMLIVGLIRRAR
ncbi:MAG: lmo0937 family membrane protein, partial [Gemmatimonadales bacterium]|nr:lmo0937 family membrane protein [Gemmatimonadales bacterium]